MYVSTRTDLQQLYECVDWGNEKGIIQKTIPSAL